MKNTCWKVWHCPCSKIEPGTILAALVVEPSYRGIRMGGQRFSEEQIMRILREVKLGMKVTEVCPRYGISEQTYYRWKAKYAEPEVHQAVRIRQLQEENEQLRERLTTLGVEHQELKDRLRIE